MSKTVIDIFRFIISAVILPQLFKCESIPNTAAKPIQTIFSCQVSLARQAFLITPLHGARYKTGKNAYAKQ